MGSQRVPCGIYRARRHVTEHPGIVLLLVEIDIHKHIVEVILGLKYNVEVCIWSTVAAVVVKRVYLKCVMTLSAYKILYCCY